MTKENLNTTENKKTQGEKVMKKFVDEEQYIKHHNLDGEKSLTGLYKARDIIINDLPEMLSNIEDEKIEKYYEKNILFNKNGAREIRNVIENIVYFLKIEHSAQIFAIILEQAGLKERTAFVRHGISYREIITDTYDKYLKLAKQYSDAYYARLMLCIGIEALNHIASRYRLGIYSINGEYKKVRIKYEYFSDNIQSPYTYAFKTSAYNEADKTIEIYMRKDFDETKEDFSNEFKKINTYSRTSYYKNKPLIEEIIEKMKNFNKKQGEKIMKKEIIIDMVANTYEIVGKARTINNCTGIDNGELRAAAKYIFGNNEEEENENKKLLVDYYKNQTEGFFDSYELSGEELVGRMAKDLIKAKANRER